MFHDRGTQKDGKDPIDPPYLSKYATCSVSTEPITNYQLSNYQLPIMHNITAESTVTTSSRLIISYQRIEQTNKAGKIFSSVLNQSTQTLAFTC